MPFSWHRISKHVRHVTRRRTIGVSRREGELDAIVGENGVDLVWHGRDQGDEEGRCRSPSCLPDQLHESELARAINGDVEIKLALGGLHLGDVDVEVADRVGLELLSCRLVAFDLRQPEMPCRCRQRCNDERVRCGIVGCKAVKAVVERQQRVLAEGDDDRLLLDRQHRRPRFLRSGRQVGHRAPLPPLGDGLLVDPVALGQRPQALLTMLYRSTDRLCRCGAPVKNLAHSASFHSMEKNAPSNAGTKHLVQHAGFGAIL